MTIFNILFFIFPPCLPVGKQAGVMFLSFAVKVIFVIAFIPYPSPSCLFLFITQGFLCTPNTFIPAE